METWPGSSIPCFASKATVVVATHICGQPMDGVRGMVTGSQELGEIHDRILAQPSNRHSDEPDRRHLPQPDNCGVEDHGGQASYPAAEPCHHYVIEDRGPVADVERGHPVIESGDGLAVHYTGTQAEQDTHKESPGQQGYQDGRRCRSR